MKGDVISSTAVAVRGELCRILRRQAPCEERKMSKEAVIPLPRTTGLRVFFTKS